MTASRRISLGLVVSALMVPAALLAQGRPDSHTVNRGDTLWDLARTYMGDPLLWPEIYRLNTNVVEDPHWIYPGEVLRLAPGGDVSAVPSTDTPPPADQVEADSAMADAAPGDMEAEPADSLAEPQVGDLAVDNSPDRRDDVDLRPLVGDKARRISAGPSLEVALARAYRPIRRSEFYSSGFLTEGERLPYGALLGTVTPMQIGVTYPITTASLFTRVAVRPPEGGRYQVGDTLLAVKVQPEVGSYGNAIIPVGLLRVTDVSRGENVAEVIALYGQMVNGLKVLPADKFVDPGNVRPVPISDGIQGKVLAHRDLQPLTGPQDVLFLDRGKQDGVALGDLFELRQEAQKRIAGPDLVDDVMATVQVVHVGEKHSTARVVKVTQPDITAGTPAKQVAKLPS